MAIIKKKRVSKRNKISWRKHVNIDDVEEFLEEKRFEERVVPHLSIISNDELFTIDNKQSDELLSAKEKKQLRLSRPLKCFSMLQSHSKVPDPITKRNRVRTKEERKNILIKKKEEENRSKGILKAKQLQSIADKKLREIKNKAVPKKDDFCKNIWGGEDEKFPIESEEWVTNNTKKHNLRGIGKLQKNIAKSLSMKKSVLPPVEAPHPGMSYNPSYEDHQNLLKMIADKELDIIKQEKHLERVTRNMFSKVTEDKRDTTWLSEMSEGLPKTNEEVDDSEFSDNEYKSINPPVKNSKKTLQKKRKQKEERKLKLERLAVKIEKKKITDIHGLKLLKQDLENLEKKLNAQKEKRDKVKSLKEKQTKRLGALKFEEAELDFNLCTEVTGNLRNLKQEGNLLSDRYKSLQKRNVVEPTVKRNRKRSKVKKFTKPGHKDDWIKTVAR